MEFRYQTESGQLAVVRLERSGDGFRAAVATGDEPERHYSVSARQLAPGVLLVTLGDRAFRAHVATAGGVRYVATGGRTAVLAAPPPPGKKHGPGAGQDSLEATMPGQVIAVNITPGETVERGQPLVILEAMKMELRVLAPHAGRVRTVTCQVGDVVERGQVLVELAGEEEEA